MASRSGTANLSVHSPHARSSHQSRSHFTIIQDTRTVGFDQGVSRSPQVGILCASGRSRAGSATEWNGSAMELTGSLAFGVVVGWWAFAPRAWPDETAMGL